MPDLTQNGSLSRVSEIFHKVKEEVQRSNWHNALEFLNGIIKISLGEELKSFEASAYYQLGEIYQFIADSQKSREKIFENFKLALSNFQKAYDIFKDLKNEEKQNACLGFINLLKYISETEKESEEKLLDSAKKYFNQAKLLTLKEGNLIDSLKMEILESRALSLFIGEKLIRIDENTNFKQLASEAEKLILDIWDKIINQQDLSEIYLYFFLANVLEFSTWSIIYLPTKDFDIKQYISKISSQLNEFIKKYENSNKITILFYANAMYAYLNMIFAIQHVTNQVEQKLHFKKAQKWIKKGEILLTQIQNNPTLACFYFTRFTTSIFLIATGFFTRDFKNVLKDLDLSIDSASLIFPKIMVTNILLYTAGIILAGAHNRATPKDQRIDFAQKALYLIDSATNQISAAEIPSYEILNIDRNVLSCAANAVLGDILKDNNTKSRHLRLASDFFWIITNYDDSKINDTHFYYHIFLYFASRTGPLLARNTENISEQVDFYKKTIELLLKSKKMMVPLFHQENLFLIGDIYLKIAKLTNEEKLFKESYSSYIDAIEYCKNKGYFNLEGSAYVSLAQIDDRLGNYTSAAENYKKAINSFDKAILTLTYTNLGKKIEKLKNYIKAWNIIETAKGAHANEDHQNAYLYYEQASQILNNLRDYQFESPFYSAWSILEKAEDLSKQNKHQEAAATYLVSNTNFHDTIEALRSALSKKRSFKEKDRIQKLIQVANLRANYCSARYQIETARLESKKGNHLLAAELYNKAGAIFENLCQIFKVKREKQELIAIYYLCKAWESMEQANLEQLSSYAVASELFEKACDNFPESRMKKLSLGNSLYCSALKFGSQFDKTTNLEEKINYYKKIKMFLREASRNYQMGGFEQDSKWALATSTFFDGIWHLILSDNEIDFSKKNQYLNIAKTYLNNALQIFDEAGYNQKRDEVSNYLEMIKNEQEILTSALNIIEKPAISESSIGISAPSCPIEI
ncbi:MAG: tetratricopeptide repeat protein, partial [Promethearchaeota archaeon]